MKRGLTPKELDSMNFDLFDFDGEWFDAFAKPQTSGVWFIWGNSGNGKTSVSLKLAKCLSQFKKLTPKSKKMEAMKVVYNSLEEGKSPTMQKAFREVGMNQVNGKVMLICEGIEDLDKRVSARRGPDIIFIDSWQYLNITFKQLLAFLAKHPTKLFVILSQAEGKMPLGRSAKQVMYHAALKIWVEGHRAISKGRYIGTLGYYTNWTEGANKYWEQ